jgi:hypothetical protein
MNAIRHAQHRNRSSLHMGKHYRGYSPVILHHIPFGKSVFREKDFIGVAYNDNMPIDDYPFICHR